MKTFNASDLAHKRTEIFNAAKAEGAILQKKNTNGVVLDEFILMPKIKASALHIEGVGQVTVIDFNLW